MRPTTMVLALLSVLLIASCKSKKNAGVTAEELSPNTGKIALLLDSIDQNISNPSTLSIKSKVHFKTPKMSDSFKMHIRMKKDSLIWISATYYKVEVARLLMLPDSVKMIDRKNGKYYLGDYKYIQNRFKVPLDFDFLQSIILGNPFNLDSAVKVRAYSSRGNHIIASLYNLWYDNGSGDAVLKQQMTQIWIDPETYRISKSIIKEYKGKKSFMTEYSDTVHVDGYPIPNGAKYTVKDEAEMIFTSEYLKIESKKDMSFPFTISSKYEPIF